jgi:hypothetical protein
LGYLIAEKKRPLPSRDAVPFFSSPRRDAVVGKKSPSIGPESEGLFFPTTASLRGEEKGCSTESLDDFYFLAMR